MTLRKDMFVPILLIAVLFAVVVLTACTGVDHPARNVQEEKVGELEGNHEEVTGSGKLKYTFFAKSLRGSTTTVDIYEEVLFFRVEDRNGSMDKEERLATLRFLIDQGFNLAGASITPEPHKGGVYNEMLIYPKSMSVDAGEEKEKNITIIGGGILVDTEGIEDERETSGKEEN